MRLNAKGNGIRVKAYSGTTGVLLAMDIDPGLRKGLLGFAIERSGPNDPLHWLPGLLTFPGQVHDPGDPVLTNAGPVQKFRWSDYTVHADTRYDYTIHPVYGTPNQPAPQQGVNIGVTTASTTTGKHRVLFNRAAAASQSFARHFPDLTNKINKAKPGTKKNVVLTPDALAWLGRGVPEVIANYISAAKAGDALDIAIYEYELPMIIDAVNNAQKRGVELRIVFHAKPNDAQTTENKANLKPIPAAAKRARITSRICHDKYIIHSTITNGTRNPQAVLCGSTNFTENGCYRQANVTHQIYDANAAKTYLEFFEALWNTATDPAATKHYIDDNNPISAPIAPPLFIGFSPRTKRDDLDTFVSIIQGVKRDVLFSTVFALDATILKALLGKAHDPILRFGIQNTRSTITGVHADRTAQFAATAMLNTGLEGWLKESTAGQKGNILIHTKMVVADFTSDNPIVISGSHNLSKPASNGNDENYLIIQDPDVADVYGVEALRIYDHYRYRYTQKTKKTKTPPHLTPDNTWTDRYFTPNTLPERDRKRFSGQ